MREKGSIFVRNWWFIQRKENIGQVGKPMESLQNDIKSRNKLLWILSIIGSIIKKKGRSI